MSMWSSTVVRLLLIETHLNIQSCDSTYVVFPQCECAFAGGLVEVLEGEVLVVEVVNGGVARKFRIGATFFLSLQSPKLYFKWKSLAVC